MAEPGNGGKSAELSFVELELGQIIGRWPVPDHGFAWVTADPPNGGPCLVARPGPLHFYGVMRRPTLVATFERLAEHPNQSAILRFANRWGHLTNELKTVAPDPPEPGYRLGESQFTWLDELAAFWRLRLLWRDVTVIENSDIHGPRSVRLARERVAAAVVSSGKRVQVVVGGDRGGRYDLITPADVGSPLADRLEDGKPRELVRYLLAREVNSRLQGVSPALLPFMANRIRLTPGSLLAAVYWRFAVELSAMETGGYPERPCDYCHRLYRARSNKRYCSRTCKDDAYYRQQKDA